MVIKAFGLPKKEHLTGEIRIGELYKKGSAFLVFPMRIVYRIVPREDDVAVKVLFGAPKRQFKHAVDRNRFKRLMREAYRQQKAELVALCEERNMKLHVSFTAVSKELPTQQKVMEKMDKALGKLYELLICEK